MNNIKNDILVCREKQDCFPKPIKKSIFPTSILNQEHGGKDCDPPESSADFY